MITSTVLPSGGECNSVITLVFAISIGSPFTDQDCDRPPNARTSELPRPESGSRAGGSLPPIEFGWAKHRNVRLPKEDLLVTGTGERGAKF